MKICFDGRVLTHKHLTGVERYTKELLDNLKNILPICVKTPKISNRLLQHLWEHLILPIECGKMDVFIAPSNVGPIVFPNKGKYILVVHDVAYVNYPSAYNGIFKRYYEKVIPLAMKRADVVITVSESERRNIVKSYPFVKDKIKVVYPGLNNKLISAQPLPLERREPYILYVGSLNPRKNLKGILMAFDILKKRTNRNIKLKIVGANYSVFKQVSLDTHISLSNVEFLGYVSEDGLHQLYSRAMIFVFPSFYEGFGYPPLEAMSFGTPAVVSNLSSLPEVTKDRAVYVNPYDAESIATAMLKLIENDRYWMSLSHEAKEVTESYTWEKSVNQLVSIMESLIGKRL